MARWQPGATERLVVAAVDLFTEQGYDATTVAQIAERAGVTKSTFFRHFPDKRELLVAGQESMCQLLSEGVAEAPAAVARASSDIGTMPGSSVESVVCSKARAEPVTNTTASSDSRVIQPPAVPSARVAPARPATSWQMLMMRRRS